MMTLLDPRTWIAALLIALAGFGLGYLRGEANGEANGKATVQAQWDKAKLEQQQVVAQTKDKDINQGQQASARYQEQKANEKERIRIVRQVVTRTVTGECFDAGSLQHLNETIRPISAASAAR